MGPNMARGSNALFFLDAPGMLNLYYPIFPVRLGNHSELNMEPNTAKGSNAFFLDTPGMLSLLPNISP